MKYKFTTNICNNFGGHSLQNNCGICKKAFSLKRNLLNHMFIHKEQKSHKCNIYVKLFSQKGHLKLTRLFVPVRDHINIIFVKIRFRGKEI